jgi:hypothetical protein
MFSLYYALKSIITSKQYEKHNNQLVENKIYKLYKENNKLKTITQIYISKFYQSNYNYGNVKNRHILMYNIHEIEFIFLENSEVIKEYTSHKDISKDYLNTLIHRTKNTIKNVKNDLRKM